jgi:beta-lactam-binding protein with PASTA domain
MRRRVPLAAAAVCALAGGCGGDRPPPPPPPVRLAITSPRDQEVVRRPQVELRGTVRPADAAVTVDGRRAAVVDGEFRATVALRPGTNVIDVLASAGRARPALTAIRVRRRVSVRVPDLVGLAVDDARARLTDLGLKADVSEQGGLFDRLLPGDPNVCSTDPGPGDEVDPGTTVRVVVARRC